MWGQVRNHTRSCFEKKSSAPGSEVAWDKWRVQKNHVLRTRFAPGSEAAQDKWFVQKKCHILRNSSAPGSEAAWDKLFLPKKNQISGTSSAPGSEAARDRWLFPYKVNIMEKFSPRQRSCPGQVASSKKIDFLVKVLPQAAKLPRTSGFFKKSVDFLAKVLPQAAKLPGTSGFFKFIFELPIHRPGGRFVTT